MSESFSSSFAVASATATRGPASAVSFSSSAARSRSIGEYPWYYPDRRPGEIEVFVQDGEIDVSFEEPNR